MTMVAMTRIDRKSTANAAIELKVGREVYPLLRQVPAHVEAQVGGAEEGDQPAPHEQETACRAPEEADDDRADDDDDEVDVASC